MSHKSVLCIFLFFLLGTVFFVFLGCEVSDINKKDSVTSGTSTGSGSSGSGGAPASVTVNAGSNSLGTGATTTITVIVTDASGRRTDASLILTSSLGGTFNGSNAILNGNTSGGVFVADYKAVNSGEDEVSATVSGAGPKGSTIIIITGSVTP